MDNEIDLNSRRKGLDLARKNLYFGRKALDLNRDQITKQLDTKDAYIISNSITTESSYDYDLNEENPELSAIENTTKTNDEFLPRTSIESSELEALELIKSLKNDSFDVSEDRVAKYSYENIDAENEYDNLLLELKEISNKKFENNDNIIKNETEKFSNWLLTESLSSKISKTKLSLATCEDLFSCNDEEIKPISPKNTFDLHCAKKIIKIEGLSK